MASNLIALMLGPSLDGGWSSSGGVGEVVGGSEGTDEGTAGTIDVEDDGALVAAIH